MCYSRRVIPSFCYILLHIISHEDHYAYMVLDTSHTFQDFFQMEYGSLVQSVISGRQIFEAAFMLHI